MNNHVQRLASYNRANNSCSEIHDCQVSSNNSALSVPIILRRVTNSENHNILCDETGEEPVNKGEHLNITTRSIFAAIVDLLVFKRTFLQFFAALKLHCPQLLVALEMLLIKNACCCKAYRVDFGQIEADLRVGFVILFGA